MISEKSSVSLLRRLKCLEVAGNEAAAGFCAIVSAQCVCALVSSQHFFTLVAAARACGFVSAQWVCALGEAADKHQLTDGRKKQKNRRCQFAVYRYQLPEDAAVSVSVPMFRNVFPISSCYQRRRKRKVRRAGQRLCRGCVESNANDKAEACDLRRDAV